MITELLFADAAAPLAHNEPSLQEITSCFADTALHFGLEVSLKKMVVLHHPAPLEEYHPPVITIGQTELKAVQQFNYLGSVMSHNAKIDRGGQKTG